MHYLCDIAVFQKKKSAQECHVRIHCPRKVNIKQRL